MYRKFSDGIIEVITGPMFSGKSEELIKRIKILSYAEIPTLIVKPAIDTRFSNNEIISRNGTSIKSFSIENVGKIKELLQQKDYKALVIDEAQFFEYEIVPFIEELALKGMRIIVCGLDQNYKREPFRNMADLIAKADSVAKLKAVCWVCKNAATCTYRTSNNTETIVIGDIDQYEARCRTCHEKGEKEKNKK